MRKRWSSLRGKGFWPAQARIKSAGTLHLALSAFSIILTPTCTVAMADSDFENTRYPARSSSIGGTCDPSLEWEGENFSPVQPERTMYQGQEETWLTPPGRPSRQGTSTVAELGELNSAPSTPDTVRTLNELERARRNEEDEGREMPELVVITATPTSSGGQMHVIEEEEGRGEVQRLAVTSDEVITQLQDPLGRQGEPWRYADDSLDTEVTFGEQRRGNNLPQDTVTEALGNSGGKRGGEKIDEGLRRNLNGLKSQRITRSPEMPIFGSGERSRIPINWEPAMPEGASFNLSQTLNPELPGYNQEQGDEAYTTGDDQQREHTDPSRDERIVTTQRNSINLVVQQGARLANPPTSNGEGFLRPGITPGNRSRELTTRRWQSPTRPYESNPELTTSHLSQQHLAPRGLLIGHSLGASQEMRGTPVPPYTVRWSGDAEAAAQLTPRRPQPLSSTVGRQLDYENSEYTREGRTREEERIMRGLEPVPTLWERQPAPARAEPVTPGGKGLQPLTSTVGGQRDYENSEYTREGRTREEERIMRGLEPVPTLWERQPAPARAEPVTPGGKGLQPLTSTVGGQRDYENSAYTREGRSQKEEGAVRGSKLGPTWERRTAPARAGQAEPRGQGPSQRAAYGGWNDAEDLGRRASRSGRETASDPEAKPPKPRSRNKIPHDGNTGSDRILTPDGEKVGQGAGTGDPHRVNETTPRRQSQHVRLSTATQNVARVVKKPNMLNDPQDWEAFKDSFLGYIRLQDIPEESWVSIMLTFLSPSLQQRCQALKLSKNELENVNVAVQRIDGVMTAPVSKLGARLQLSTVVQGDRLVTEFTNEIRTKARACNFTEENARDAAMLSALVSGLRDQDAVLEILKGDIDSFERGVRVAQSLETAKKARINTGQSLREEVLYEIKASNVANKSTAELIDKQKVEIEELRTQLINLKLDRRRPNGNDGKCYYCGSATHYVRECRLKREEQRLNVRSGNKNWRPRDREGLNQDEGYPMQTPASARNPPQNFQ